MYQGLALVLWFDCRYASWYFSGAAYLLVVLVVPALITAGAFTAR